MVFGRKPKENIVPPTTESRKERNSKRFKNVASRRVDEILNKFRLLKNCANTGNYYYTVEDKKKIFNAIESSLREVKSEFNKGAPKTEKFSFD